MLQHIFLNVTMFTSSGCCNSLLECCNINHDVANVAIIIEICFNSILSMLQRWDL